MSVAARAPARLATLSRAVSRHRRADRLTLTAGLTVLQESRMVSNDDASRAVRRPRGRSAASIVTGTFAHAWPGRARHRLMREKDVVVGSSSWSRDARVRQSSAQSLMRSPSPLAVVIAAGSRARARRRGDKSRTASAKNDARVKNRFQMNLGGPGRCEDREAKP